MNADNTDNHLPEFAWGQKRPAMASDFFVAGGTLRFNASSYVNRPADDELFNRTLAGEFCYVLTPRQMGKSSLMVRTVQRLREYGISTADVDLTRIGININEEQFYLSVLTQILRGLELSVNLQQWWQEHDYLTYVQRFTDFLRDVVINEVAERIVVFIDEIDSTLSLDFRDDFFAGIRSLYNTRASDPRLERLTFVLLGVASPSDLIKDSNRTPFNIGDRIALSEFSKEDALVLKTGLDAEYPGQGHAIYERVFFWTNGHPYLTQKLCLSVVEKLDGQWTTERIDRLVESLFLVEEVRSESNLKFVQDRILKSPQRRELLKIYNKVLNGQKVKDDRQSVFQNELKLSGIVKVENGYLSIRNEIYRRAFDKNWVQKNLPTNWVPVIAVGSTLIALLAIGVLLFNVWVENRVSNASRQFVAEVDADRRLDLLAEIYNRQAILFNQDYDDVANSLFYGLPTWQEQKALFSRISGRTGSEVVANVVRGLYTTLADVNNSNRSELVLEEMSSALERVPQTQDSLNLRNEIQHWLIGREYVRQGDWEKAHEFYKLAIENNQENPATRYERAKVLIHMDRYQEALLDLDQVIAIAQKSRKSDEATPTPSQASSVLLTPSAITSTFTTTLPITQITIPRQSLTPGHGDVEVTDQNQTTTPTPFSMALQPTETPIVTQEDVNDRITSNFANYLQIVSEVIILIDATPGLSNNLASAQDDEYPNLRPILPSLAMPQAELTVSQASIKVVRGTNSETEVGKDSIIDIQLNDRIQAEDEGRGVLRFRDHLEVDIFGPAEIILLTAENLESDGSIHVMLGLAYGNIRVRLDEQAIGELTVETEDRSITTIEQGTEFVVSHAAGKLTDIAVLKGAVELVDDEGNKLILREGEAI